MSAQGNALGKLISITIFRPNGSSPNRCVGPPPSGLGTYQLNIPRALPWADMGSTLRA